MSKYIIQGRGNKISDSNQIIINALESLGKEVVYISGDDISIHILGGIIDVFVGHKRLDSSKFEGMYLRVVGSDRDFYATVVAFAQQNGVDVIDARGIQNYGEKLNTYHQLSKFQNEFIQIKLIDSIFGTSLSKKGLQELLGNNIVYKPVDGKGGKGVSFVNLEREVMSSTLNTNGMMVQRHILNSGDIRILIVGGQILFSLMRNTKNQYQVNNLSMGGTGKIVGLPELLAAECCQIAKILGYDICGIDLVQDTNTGDYYLLEVNRSPQIALSQQFIDFSIGDKVAEYLVSRLGA